MANATKVTINSLAVNVPTTITESVLDTGTDAVTLPLTPAGDTHNILLKFENTTETAYVMTVDILAGDYPPAFLAGAGDLQFSFTSAEVAYVVLDSARFMQDDGTILIKSTPAKTQTQTLKVTAFQLPK